MDNDADLRETARAMRTALAKLNRRMRAHDDSGDVGSTALSLLGRLWRGGSSTATELAAQEHLKPQSLTRALAALEADHLIVRATDESDRRRSTITITEMGIETLRRSARSRESWLANAMASTLSATERDMLRIAATLVERLSEADE